MRRLGILLIFATAVATGCRKGQNATNPFLGRTTVPPPGTGQAVPQPPPAQYYNNGNPTPGGAAPGGAAPAYTPPGGSYQSSPPAGRPDWSSRSSLDRGETTVASRDDPVDASQDIPDENVRQAAYEESPQADEEAASSLAGEIASAVREPRRLRFSDKPVDIMDLPPARSQKSFSPVGQILSQTGMNPLAQRAAGPDRSVPQSNPTAPKAGAGQWSPASKSPQGSVTLRSGPTTTSRAASGSAATRMQTPR